MKSRCYQRTPSQPRPIKIIPHYTKMAAGSVLVEVGETKVLCTVCIEDGVPNWMRGKKGEGWLTAEYSLLPGSTHDRSRRERPNVSGRTHEIQRLIGRCLRGVIDLKLLGERTIMIDCDVIQADGGTRCASITGAYAALKLAIDKLLKSGKVRTNPLKEAVAAISVGICEGEILVDLDYQEDSNAEVDANIVMTASGGILEVQSTAEKGSFTRAQLTQMLDLAQQALDEVFEEQAIACD